jgi:eukaryotic-like serine/threonine-protein kinase
VLTGQTDSTETQVGTRSGLVLGTLGYMAPEQVRGEVVDHRADLFNFGAILYEMLSGQRAFRGKSDVETMHAIVKEEPDLAGLNSHVPSALPRIIRHCLEKSPQERYQSASDIAFDLEMVADPASTSLAPQAARLKKWERLAWVGVNALLIAALTFTVRYLRRAPTDVQAVYFSVSAPEKTTFTGGTAPAISPDGRYLAFVAEDSSGKSQLYLRAFDSPGAQALDGTEGAWQPFCSPDSRFLGYFAQGKLKKIPIGGGPPQPLCDVVIGVGGTWSRDGVIIFSPTYGLYRVSQDGGPVTPVATSLEGTGQVSQIEKGRWSPQFLPDGRHFLFIAYSNRPEIRGIYVGSLDSEETKRLLSAESHVAYTSLGYLLFIRDSTLMAQPFDADRLQLIGEPFPVADQVTNFVHGLKGSFAVSETGALAYFRGGDTRQLTWFNRAGEELGPVGVPDAYSYPSLSPDEKTIAVTKNSQGGASDIWLIDLGRGHPSRFTFDPERDFLPIWSPDGSRIVFTSSRNGSWDLYQKAVSGTAQEELLLKSNDSKFPTDWSWDGRFIAYNRQSPDGGTNLWVLPLFGDRKPIPFVHSEFYEMFGYFSPNGRWLAYVSDESGRSEVYVRPFPVSAGISPVSTGGGRQPRWRRDGRELFYLSLHGKLMVVEVNGGDGFRAGAPKALFQMRLPSDFSWGSGNYAVTADGQRFLVTTPAGEAASPTIAVVLNWPAAVKKGRAQ